MAHKKKKHNIVPITIDGHVYHVHPGPTTLPRIIQETGISTSTFALIVALDYAGLKAVRSLSISEPFAIEGGEVFSSIS